MSIILDYFQPDVLYAYTAFYTWTSNQTAHTLLGFFLALVLAVRYPGRRHWIAWAFAVPVAKEIADTLLYALSSSSREGVVPIPWGAILRDNLTDIYFWSWGIVMGMTSVLPGFGRRRWPWLLGSLVLGCAVTVPVATPWLKGKRALDESHLPQNYVTLTRFPSQRLDSGTQKVQAFAREVGQPGTPTFHLVIERGKPMDRSALAIALGVELAEGGQRVEWLPAVKILDDPGLIAEIFQQADRPGPCQCVVIDDLDTSLPIPETLLQQRFDSPELKSFLEVVSYRALDAKMQLLKDAPPPVPAASLQAQNESQTAQAQLKDNVAAVWKQLLDHFKKGQTTGFVWVLSSHDDAGRDRWLQLIQKLAALMGGGAERVELVVLKNET